MYEPHIFDAKVELVLRVEAANSNHARQKLTQLLSHRITQYSHPEDIQPAKVIAVIIDGKVWTPERIKIDEGNSTRSSFNPEKAS
jgi:hypothetical protein